MTRSIYEVSLINSLYFSFATFFILFTSSVLFETLQKTTGQLSLGTTILIVLCLILVLFVVAIANIILGEEAYTSEGYSSRVFAVLLFVVVSSIILGILWFVFFYQL